LTSKASTYLQCWHDVVDGEVADMAGCEEAMTDCSEKLAALESSSEEEDGEAEEGDEAPDEEEEEEDIADFLQRGLRK
jgi:hypothetical protein